ncbi:cation transporter [Klenkia terrae]
MSSATNSTTSPAPAGGDQVELAIGGMTCASCAMRIEKRLNKLDGVSATVNYATEKAKVTFADGVAPDDLVAAVEKAGYTARLPEPPRPEMTGAEGEEPDGRDPVAPLRQRLLVSTVLTVPVIAMAMIPALQFTYWQWLSLTLAAPVVVWGPIPSTGLPGRTCDTARPPWTRSSRWAPWPPSGGRCTRCSSARQACPA